MKIKEILKIANEQLSNIEESILKIKILLSSVLEVSKEYLIIHDEDEISEKTDRRNL